MSPLDDADSEEHEDDDGSRDHDDGDHRVVHADAVLVEEVASQETVAILGRAPQTRDVYWS